MPWSAKTFWTTAPASEAQGLGRAAGAEAGIGREAELRVDDDAVGNRRTECGPDYIGAGVAAGHAVSDFLELPLTSWLSSNEDLLPISAVRVRVATDPPRGTSGPSRPKERGAYVVAP
jgi:hypothetical protein